MYFSMSYQPEILDTPIDGIWDLATVNTSFQKGVLQTAQLVLNFYASPADIGIKQPLDSVVINCSMDNINAFQTAENISATQLAQWAYGLAQAVDTLFSTATITN